MSRHERVLLIGGTGFIGGALTRRLVGSGFEVDILTREFLHRSPDGVRVHGGGIENLDTLRRLLAECGTVVHAASATTPSLSARSPTLESRTNLSSTIALIEEMQNHTDARLIYLSSGGTVYGDPQGATVDEQARLAPLSYYGAAKVAAETFLGTYAHLSGASVTVLRPANVYGPGQPLYQGFGVIRTLFQHAIDATTMSVWGDGEIVRDFIYVEDLVSAIEVLINSGQAGGTFNAGSGTGVSLNDLIGLVRSTSGRAIRVEYLPARKLDVRRVVLDSSALRSAVGWTAVTDIREGLARTWRSLSDGR